ncbi:MAG: SDR family NAD(P)-dependent oxidoreductase [Actinomycetota bacterium]|nr:SDR family NAD(P)-dependent oxidoreductase [Actinomycetota bacterium]MDD5667143.1 SDR family NAD(P)-dependent oxidoreductase [Actinomycetota bacterium]
MKDLNGKIAVVTGAARGMGRLHAENLGREGCVVVLTDVDGAGLDEAARDLVSRGFEAHGYELDVSDRAACFEVCERVRSEVGPIDILINNAGITECYAVLDLSERAVRRMAEVNYMGYVWMMQAVVPEMAKRGRGHVVNICSVAGKVGTAKMGGYCATKFADIGITDAIRMETRGSGVDFTIVNPGYVSTGMFEGGKVPFITRWQDPMKVSRAMVDAIKKNKAEICVPRSNVLLVAFLRGLCMPKLIDFAFHAMGVDKSMDGWCRVDERPF